jgi:RNA polymerase sigma-70 factor, ECF subfamily
MLETQNDISIEALRAGDRVHFSRLVDAYSTPIYRLALKMLGNEQDAEDVLQTTFIKAFQHVSNFEGRSSLSTWLYRIAANEALMSIRRKHPSISLDEELQDDDGNIQEPLEFADWSALPESDMLSAESRIVLDRAIEGLPIKLRAVFLMRDIEGLSIKETSEALDLTETAVKTRLLRARLFLREKLSGYFGERLRQEKNNEA